MLHQVFQKAYVMFLQKFVYLECRLVEEKMMIASVVVDID